MHAARAPLSLSSGTLPCLPNLPCLPYMPCLAQQLNCAARNAKGSQLPLSVHNHTGSKARHKGHAFQQLHAAAATQILARMQAGPATHSCHSQHRTHSTHCTLQTLEPPSTASQGGASTPQAGHVNNFCRGRPKASTSGAGLPHRVRCPSHSYCFSPRHYLSYALS